MTRPLAHDLLNRPGERPTKDLLIAIAVAVFAAAAGLVAMLLFGRKEVHMDARMGMSTLEAFVWFGAFLSIMVAGYAAFGWWLLRHQGD